MSPLPCEKFQLGEAKSGFEGFCSPPLLKIESNTSN